MEVISFIVLILLSMFGYTVGAVARAGKSAQLKLQIVDLILILVIFGGAIYSRVVLDWNKWLIILIWVALSGLIGVLATWPRKFPERKNSIDDSLKKNSRNPLKRLWRNWSDFAKRTGSFQSGVILSLLFFTIVLPFALAVRLLSDPLKLKYRGNKSHWLNRPETEVNLEQFRRQF